MNVSVAVIVSTYNQPEHLKRCLLSLSRQTHRDFGLIIADDGSSNDTRAVIEGFSSYFDCPLKHIWQPDQGFRKTLILNKAILATRAEYLIFTDGDCMAQPDFVGEHLRQAKRAAYVCGALIRLNERVTRRIGPLDITSGHVFQARWLSLKSHAIDRRFLRLSLPYERRCWLNEHSPTPRYWLGANSSCFRGDALAVNGFDNRFTYGFEDGDFGNRLENYGLSPRTVRWTANALHLYHRRPWASPEALERNHRLMTPRLTDGEYLARDGIAQIPSERRARKAAVSRPAAG